MCIFHQIFIVLLGLFNKVFLLPHVGLQYERRLQYCCDQLELIGGTICIPHNYEVQGEETGKHFVEQVLLISNINNRATQFSKELI